MAESRSNQVADAEVADTRWKDLYRIGCISCIAFPASIVIAVMVYFIWPYAPELTSVADIFAVLQNDRLAGLMSIELSVLVLLPIMILQLLAVYVALKRVNESYALIALVLGLTGIVLWLTARPVAEMAALSDGYAAATSDSTKSQYLAAGEAFNALFNGTAWMLSQFLISFSSLISSLLMVRSRVFSKATAYVGIGLSVFGLSFWIPVIGPILSLLGTIGGVIWYILMARDFYRLGWGKSTASQAA